MVVAAGAALVVPSVLGGGVGVGVSAGVLVSAGRSAGVRRKGVQKSLLVATVVVLEISIACVGLG